MVARHEIRYSELYEQMLSLSEGKYRTSETIMNIEPLEIPKWKWESISIDFVMGLPRTSARYDAVWVVADRLSLLTFYPFKQIILWKN